MTAVMSATDALRRDRIMASLDNDQLNYSSGGGVDWKAKYDEVADMLAETRAELDDFHHSSKELEEELERELERTEKSQEELKVKVTRAESERDEWKSKFMSLQTTHNTTTTSLQRELDKLRQEHQQTKVQLRELEMGNDELENNERAVTSSLADTEAKYSRALEEKILLEHELLDKANIEEECQRLKDELRDANVEVAILKDQLTAAQSVSTPVESVAPSSLYRHMSSTSSDDNLLSTVPPPDLQLADLEEPIATIRASRPSTGKSSLQTDLLHGAGFQPPKSSSPPRDSSLIRSTAPRSVSQTRMPPPRAIPTPRPVPLKNTSNLTTNSTGSTASRNKGVQMVSEMRARVRNLEQKIHTRVPRLRMGSMTSRPSGLTTPSASAKPVPVKVQDVIKSRRSIESVSSDSSRGGRKKATSASDTSGWVLIMEDSPSPIRAKLSEAEKDRERRRASSPIGPTAFRPMASTSSATSPTINPRALPLYHSVSSETGTRKAQSRHSAASTTSSSSIPTPSSSNSSRPQTPTFLPMPSTSKYSRSSMAGLTSLKRSTGDALNAQLKRSSLGSSGATERGYGHKERPTTMPPPPRPVSISPATSTSSAQSRDRDLPRLPASHSNVTVRQPSLKMSSSSTLSQSKIGRPSGGSSSTSRRNSDVYSSVGLDLSDIENVKDTQEKGRARAGTTNSVFRFKSSRGGK